MDPGAANPTFNGDGPDPDLGPLAVVPATAAGGWAVVNTGTLKVVEPGYRWTQRASAVRRALAELDRERREELHIGDAWTSRSPAGSPAPGPPPSPMRLDGRPGDLTPLARREGPGAHGSGRVTARRRTGLLLVSRYGVMPDPDSMTSPAASTTCHWSPAGLTPSRRNAITQAPSVT